MPTFDIVSEVDLHEVHNAVDQANREISTRFDFKGSDAHLELKDTSITLCAESTFQLQQMQQILIGKLSKRGVEMGCLEFGDAIPSGKQAKQTVTVKQGIEQTLAKDIIKLLKESKLKVQGSIQGDQVRVTGKQRDDLQQAIAAIKSAKFELPLQFQNFRD